MKQSAGLAPGRV